ncbi:MAG: hypothetical protein GY861_08225 [bacterium]|nr:hypothetical protein [bacterium]
MMTEGESSLTYMDKGKPKNLGGSEGYMLDEFKRHEHFMQSIDDVHKMLDEVDER